MQFDNAMQLVQLAQLVPLVQLVQFDKAIQLVGDNAVEEALNNIQRPPGTVFTFVSSEIMKNMKIYRMKIVVMGLCF